LPNRLKYESSPYLLQHAENPVDWYPWGDEAFKKAADEDKPILLSIGYSTCHWCHVMAHESFEDTEIADILNKNFVSVKVDKEERPDIDSIYMEFCQAFTGSGGWPATIFMTPDKKPFFAGTYFPKRSMRRMIGFHELLKNIAKAWEEDRQALLDQAEEVLSALSKTGDDQSVPKDDLLESAVFMYKRIYDSKNGGFGSAPKFPSPHNLLFLMDYYERFGDKDCLKMAEHTLTQMYLGGLFDHIGFGFSRYSTDERFLAPHFEKMLYDNALMIAAYCQAYFITQNRLYLSIAEKTASYIFREMTNDEGAFFCSQDADSEGEEGKYYLFTPDEILRILGKEDGQAFCRHFDITALGNFEGKSIPNLLKSDPNDRSYDQYLPKLYDYRKQRHFLHTDDKILTVWNCLMIFALCRLYLASGKDEYLVLAKRADSFISKHLTDENTLYVSYRLGQRGVKGFIDDYAAYIFAQLALYRASLDTAYLDRAKEMCFEANKRFRDDKNGGYFLYGESNEPMILRPKETYDGAIPSGNSLMAWNLVQLSLLSEDESYEKDADTQLRFLKSKAARYPTGHAMFLLSLLDSEHPKAKVTVVPAPDEDISKLSPKLPADAHIILLKEPSKDYPLKNGKTTFYICKGHSCLPPTNDPDLV